MSSKFYITTTLPYVNAKPHIGFALEIIEADVLARWHRAIGDEVYFNTGTDEHGLKIFRKAEELGIPVQQYCDENAVEFAKLKESLNLSVDNFIRTTDPHHLKAAQEFWKRCEASGDIYKKNYSVKYCVGCELEKTESELVEGKCPVHPNMEIELIEEENYFFRFSKYQQALLDFYEKNLEFVLPNKRFNEIKKFVEGGLEDFSISRLKSKMPWGVEVPGDPDQVMYVWFDALVNYISAIGWPASASADANALADGEASVGKSDSLWRFWPCYQLAGKDNLRQQAAMWQAMLLSAGVANSKQIFINGFIGVNGQKMSKSLGNVISPFEMIEKFGIDGTRYLLLSGGNFGEDMDVSWEKFAEKYNADLANGIGNLVSRVLKLAEGFEFAIEEKGVDENFAELIKGLEFGKALDYVWTIIREANQMIAETKPWELLKNDEAKFKEVMPKFLEDIQLVGKLIEPFLPETAEKIKNALVNKELPMLFPRIKAGN